MSSWVEYKTNVMCDACDTIMHESYDDSITFGELDVDREIETTECNADYESNEDYQHICLACWEEMCAEEEDDDDSHIIKHEF